MSGIERELAIAQEGAVLRGTLCLPERKPAPVVVMVHGSGPLDRNSNMPGQQLDVFNAIAERLEEIGVASLRYDKRGCGVSTGDFLSAGHSRHVSDAVAWVDRIESILIRQAHQFQKEGAQWSGCGGFVRMFMMRLLGVNVAAQQRLIARIRSTTGDTLRVGLKKIPAKWLRELLEIEPRDLFAQTACPVLSISGGKDLQCNAVDAETMGRLVPGDCETHILPDLSHVLRLESGEPAFSRYPELIRKPMEPLVLDLIARWMERVSRSVPATR